MVVPECPHHPLDTVELKQKPFPDCNFGCYRSCGCDALGKVRSCDAFGSSILTGLAKLFCNCVWGNKGIKSTVCFWTDLENGADDPKEEHEVHRPVEILQCADTFNSRLCQHGDKPVFTGRTQGPQHSRSQAQACTARTSDEHSRPFAQGHHYSRSLLKVKVGTHERDNVEEHVHHSERHHGHDDHDPRHVGALVALRRNTRGEAGVTISAETRYFWRNLGKMSFANEAT